MYRFSCAVSAYEGDVFDADDYLKVYYQTDSTAKTLIPGGSFVGSVAADTAGTGDDNYTLSLNNLIDEGGNLKIFVEFLNDSITESYYIDDIQVTGIGDFVSTYNFYWEAGTVDGSVEYNGADQYALPDSTYFVYAVNKNPSTPCSSDTAQVVINRTTEQPGNYHYVYLVIKPIARCQMVACMRLPIVDGDTTIYPLYFRMVQGEELLTGTPISINSQCSGLQTGSYSVFVRG